MHNDKEKHGAYGGRESVRECMKRERMIERKRAMEGKQREIRRGSGSHRTEYKHTKSCYMNNEQIDKVT